MKKAKVKKPYWKQSPSKKVKVELTYYELSLLIDALALKSDFLRMEAVNFERNTVEHISATQDAIEVEMLSDRLENE